MKKLNLLSGLKQIRVALVLSILCLLSISKESQAQDGTSMYDAIYAGYYSSSGSSPFSDWRNNYYYGGTYYSDNYYYNPSPDVWYYIDVYDYTSLKISLCGSDFDTYLHLLDQYGNEVTSNDDSYECGSQSVIEYNNLPAGSYYIVVEGSGYADGNFSLDIQPLACNSSPSAGADINNTISAGTFSASGNYTDTRSNVDACLGNDIGQTSNDIYYQFTLNGTATVSLSHCGSGFDTYMWLLDAWGNTITYNDDNSSSPCPGTQSYIQTTLSAGTYYVVSEGYASNTGNIATSIDVNMSSPMTITYAGSSQTYVQGTPITPLSPTVTGGTPSSGGQTTISLAGNGIAGSQNGTGAAARFDWPLGTAVDASGNVYVADSENEMVRKITPEGVVTTFAGNGTRGATNGTGTGATFRHPAALAVDASGNIYVGDQQNHMIRKITPAGVVTTFAGSGAAGSANGTGSSATFNNPIGLAFDQSGNLYVADYANHKIRKISPSGVVSTYAGTGSIGATNGAAASATFKNPMSVAVDASGNVYVGDRMNYMVRKITPGGVVSTLAGSGSAGSADGTGTSASFNVPNSVAVDGSGNVYVADQLNNKIRKISPSGVVSTFAGAVTAGNTDGTGSAVRFNNPYGLCIDSQDNLYIADYHNHKIRKMMTRAFVISPDLPAGLVFNGSNGTISGTPTVASAATNYTIYAQSASSSTSPPFTMNITVQGSSNCPSLAPALSQDQNYIVTYSPRAPITSTSQLASAGVCQVQQTVQYFDGLGRPMQTVQTKGSPDADKDIVVPVEYDAYGREAKKYLPYAAPGTANGSYKSSAVTDVIGYYNGTVPAPGQHQLFSTPFAETRFEASPLNRVEEQGAPGAAWQLRSAGGRTVLTEYKSNTDQNGEYPVKQYSAISPSANHVRALQDDGYYGANQLYLTITKDENWTTGKAGTIEEYKDKEGRVVLKRTWQDNSSRLSTYYVYDDLGNLSYVLSPKAEGDNGSITQAKLDDLCYQYYYDGRRRLIEKKIPGKGWEYLVYNKLDQVVFTQDALQRTNNHWAFTKYDAFGRVVITGVYSRSITRANLESEVGNHLSADPVNNKLWEGPETNGTTGYTNVSFPKLDIAYYQQINYYGTYAIPGITASLNATQTVTTRLNGLLTGSRTYLADGSDSYLSINYYDEYGKVIETAAENHIDGTDRVVNSYNDITGELLSSTRNHTSLYDQVTVTNAYEYDHVGRRKYVKQNINNNSPIIIAKFDYAETGQLLTKNLGNTADYNNSTFTPSNFMQSVGYKYNERGWLKQSSSGLFDMVLNYQENSNQYNGNISAQHWGTLDNRTKNYSYTYDALNRLTTGSSNQGYGEDITSYDKNGNINQLIRTGGRSATQSYTYDAGNKLTHLNGLAMNYTDGNGNLNYDGTRGIGITYNYLNLPQSITGNKTISYTYDAAGRKLKKVSNISGTTDYVSGVHYKNISGIYQIEFVQTEEGRALKNGSNNQGTASYGYRFTLTDHLGNNRVTFYRNPANNNNVEVLESTDYYPFGLATIDPSAKENKYLYNGKENQEELEELDYGARFYDPVIARWNAVDPLSEVYRRFSPYAYCADNPIRFIDVDGMFLGDPLEDMQVRDNRASNLQGMVRNGGTRPHQGFDLKAAPGTSILAVKDGEVYNVINSSEGYGNQVVLKITGEDGTVSYAQYSHLSSIDVKKGQVVKEGDVMGATGQSGNASGQSLDQAHLHFEMRDAPNPGKGLTGRLDPNSVLDTKFYSQDATANQTTTGVVKVDKNGDRTIMNTDDTTTFIPNPVPSTLRPATPENKWKPTNPFTP